MSDEKKRFVLNGVSLEDVEEHLGNLRATIERQAAEMQAREASYMDALAAKSIRIDELATLIESLQTEIARLRAGAMPEEVRDTICEALARLAEYSSNSYPLKKALEYSNEINAARHWLESQPTATDIKCSACGCNEFIGGTLSSGTFVGYCNACGVGNRANLSRVPTTDKACSACGKRGKIFGEVLDDKDERIKHPLCGKCCQMWDDIDTKDDVWSAICVRRNSGAYVVISTPRGVKP